MADIRRGAAFSLWGAVYGVALFACAFIAAGGGHGSYLPFAIFGAPLSLVHPEGGLLAVVILWVAGGFLLGVTRQVRWRASFLAIHALAGGAILLWGNRFESASEQWDYFERARTFVGGYIAAGWIIYGAGQLSAWNVLWRDRREGSIKREAAA